MLNAGMMLGPVWCDSYVNWGTHYSLTDGSGSISNRTCAGAIATKTNIGSDNTKAYITTPDANGTKWDLYFDLEYGQAINYNAAAQGQPTKTVLQDFVDTYVALAESMGLKWWLEVSEVTNSGNFTYQSPYSAYESVLGPWCDYIEENCAKNFLGYSVEVTYENFFRWLRPRTTYAIANKEWSGYTYSALLQYKDPTTGVTGYATPAQRLAEIDQLVVEVFTPDPSQMFDLWVANLGAYATQFPNLPIILNVDHIGNKESWSGGPPPAGSPVDGGQGYWYPDTSPFTTTNNTNRMANERAVFIKRAQKLRDILVAARGRAFDGVIYNFVNSDFWPYGTAPTVSYHLAFVDSILSTIVGGDNTTTLNPSTSTSTSIIIGDAPVASTLTISCSATGTTGVAFSVTGKLTRNDTGAGVAGMTIQLQQYTSGTWSNVSGKTATTAADGTYIMSMTETPAGTYQLETTFAGGNV